MTTTNQATSPTSPNLTPKFGTIDTWLTLSGMGRRTTYDELGRETSAP